VQKQKDQYQGFWVVSPRGQVLSAHHQVKNDKNWTNEVLVALAEGLRQAGPLTPRQVVVRELLPFRGKGTHEDGSVSIALYVRQLFAGKIMNQCVFDTLELNAQEWREFGPAEATVGHTWLVHRDVASKLSRCLSAQSDQSTMARPNEVTSVELRGTVQEIRRGVAVVTYEGHIAALHHHPFEKGKTSSSQARWLGIGTYDLAARQMRYLIMVGSGGRREFQPHDREEMPLKFVFEWQRRTSP
jgi:hypothetical protein